MTVSYVSPRWRCWTHKPDERPLSNGMVMRRIRRPNKGRLHWVEKDGVRVSAAESTVTKVTQNLGWDWSAGSVAPNEVGLAPHPPHIRPPRLGPDQDRRCKPSPAKPAPAPVTMPDEEFWGLGPVRLLPTVSLQDIDNAASLLRQIKSQVPKTGWTCVEIASGPLLDLIDSLERGLPIRTRKHECPWAKSEPIRFVIESDWTSDFPVPVL